jgi:methylaspartate mutase sigma subunit
MSIDKKENLAKPAIVTGVIGVDAHIIGNWLISHALEQAGFEVHRLGSIISQEEFISAAIETSAKALVISSIYGMGILDLQGLRAKCEKAGLKDILLYAGGNLAAGTRDLDEAEIKSLGFTRVYPPDVNLQDFIEDLKRDLGLAL